jgi:hypothetical protein
MTSSSSPSDAEFKAMHETYSALEPLDGPARNRVLAYIMSRLEIVPAAKIPAAAAPGGNAGASTEQPAPTTFASFPELNDAARPETDADKALVAGYWLQVCQSNESFSGQAANSALKDLGHGVSNITVALERLKSQKPALALQVRKSGSSRQARKEYKITASGMRAVEAMINGSAANE